ncbi:MULTISPECIES: GntR family transcriptional regulator [Streptomyces]|nr:winged helix-turn-helix domain-containing protein [Streptomyces ruber]
MSYELDRTRPVWRQVAAAVITRIAEGEYPVGARMPTAVALSTEVDVATSTAQKAMSHLKARGLIRSEVGLGSFVAERPE